MVTQSTATIFDSPMPSQSFHDPLSHPPSGGGSGHASQAPSNSTDPSMLQHFTFHTDARGNTTVVGGGNVASMRTGAAGGFPVQGQTLTLS